MESTNQPQYVHGYFRNKNGEDIKKEDGNALIGIAMAGMSVATFAIVFIKITVAIVATATLAYYAHKFLADRKARMSQPHLVVNTLGKSSKVYL